MDSKDAPVLRAEFEQFQELMRSENEKLAAEDKRQNERLKRLEGTAEELWKMVGSIEKLAVSMENMAKEQEKQGQQLEAIKTIAGEISRVNELSEKQKELDKRVKEIEQEPAKTWKGAKEKFIFGIIGAAATAVFGGVIWLIVFVATRGAVL